MPARNLLLAFGLLLFLAFALSGIHLMEVVMPEHQDQGEIRMMARSSHIYLLFISLLILCAALIDTDFGARWIRLSVKLGQILVALAAFPLLVGYFTEHVRFGLPRNWTQAGCVLAMVGTLLVCAKAFDRRDASPW
jgi:hypothetical protein